MSVSHSSVRALITVCVAVFTLPIVARAFHLRALRWTALALAEAVTPAVRQQQSASAGTTAVTLVGPVASTSPLRDSAHGYPFNATPMDLARQGYVEE